MRTEHWPAAVRAAGLFRGAPAPSEYGKQRRPLRSFRSDRRAGFVVLLLWTAGGLLDGATLGELVGVPALVAAWMSAVVLIDLLIMRRHGGWSINSAS